ncbi:MAG TPA: acyl-CoA dehydrogenase family protein [Myxococcota bacterium]|nr:acyl-CoA dehydrogenase family protein [Myxococcota bacterium]
MEFRLDEEQQGLQDTVRRFCAARFPAEKIGERCSRGVDGAAWREMAGLGLFGVLGGEGLGVVEGAIAFEQLGAHLVNGPALWTTLAGRYVDGAATGERRAGGIADADADEDPILVEHAAEIDALLLLRADGVYLCEGSDLPRCEPLAPLDPLTPVGRCDALPSGVRVGSVADAAWLRRAGTVLCGAMLLGVSEAALEASRRYALDREQFGVPIGSFQAVQHLLADMYVRTALARSATYAAAAALDDPLVGDPLRACAAAKLLAGEAAVENARVAIQIHGGTGFTWEMLPNYLLKRAWVLENAFGDSHAHALAIGESLEGSLA